MDSRSRGRSRRAWLYSLNRRRDSPIGDPEADELLLTEPTAEADPGAPTGQVVEHRERLGDPHRVVPREDRDERPQPDPRPSAPPATTGPSIAATSAGSRRSGARRRTPSRSRRPRPGTECQLPAVHLEVGDLVVEVGELETETRVHDSISYHIRAEKKSGHSLTYGVARRPAGGSGDADREASRSRVAAGWAGIPAPRPVRGDGHRSKRRRSAITASSRASPEPMQRWWPTPNDR